MYGVSFSGAGIWTHTILIRSLKHWATTSTLSFEVYISESFLYVKFTQTQNISYYRVQIFFLPDFVYKCSFTNKLVHKFIHIQFDNRDPLLFTLDTCSANIREYIWALHVLDIID